VLAAALFTLLMQENSALPQNTGLGSTPAPNAQTMILLDPGHGGGDYGTQGIQSGCLEKNLALDLAHQLGKLLRAEGSITVVLTRTADVPLDSKHRAEIANYSEPSLLVSIHAGASGNPSASGPRVFFFGESPPLDQAPNLSANPSTLIKSGSYDRRTSTVLKLTPWDQAHVGFDSASNDLATHLQTELNNLFGASNQVMAVPLFLLKSVAMPSVVVEVGFLSNLEDEKKLQDTEFRVRLAQALKQGVMNYLAHARRLNLRDN
jgi:N-acetylmuramoyl-L-alanine amidase